jgi:hypothetical protein
MTDNIANQNGGVKPQDTNASGPSSTSTPTSGPGKSKTGPPKRRPPKQGPRPTTNEGDSQPKKRPPKKKNPNNKPDSATTSSTGNENTVPKANSEVGNATANGSKKSRNKRRKNNKKNRTDGAGDANATEVAGEKTLEPQKDELESVPPVVDGEDDIPIAAQLAEALIAETPRGKEGKLSRKQRRKLKTSQGGVLLAGAAGAQAESGKPSRKQRRLLRETMMEEAGSSEITPTATETTMTTEAANDGKQEPTDNSSKLPRTLPVVVQLDTSTDNQGRPPVHLQLDTITAAAAIDKAVLETFEASLSAPESINKEDPVPALDEETATAYTDVAFDKGETSADIAKTVETQVEAAPKKEEKAETKTKTASRDLVVETQEEYTTKTPIAYEDDNTGKKDDCECSGCIIS